MKSEIMKESKEHIIRKVNETLNILDNVEKIEASPFFATRLEGKLESQMNSKSFFSFLFTPQLKLKPALIALIILINVVSISAFLMNSSVRSNHSTEISNLLETYAFDQTDYYLLTTNEE